MKRRNVELRIEELVLRGFESSDRYRIGEAVQRELSLLFTEKGMPQSLTREHEVARLDGGTFDVEPGSKPEAIGSQVARALYRGLSR